MTPLEKRARELRGRNVARTVAAELLGMGHDRFEAMLEEWGLDWPKQTQAQRITYKGKTGTFAEHAARLGLPESTIRTRWQDGVPLDAPPRRTITLADAQRFAELRFSGISGVVAASRVGFHYNRLHKMAKAWCEGYTERLKTVKRHRRTRAELQHG